MAKCLASEGVFHLQGRNGNAVQEENDVNRIAMTRRIDDLGHHGQAIALPSAHQNGIQGRCWPWKHQPEVHVRHHLEAVAQDLERASPLQGHLEISEEFAFCGARILPFQGFPDFGLGILEKGDHDVPVQPERLVECGRGTFLIALDGHELIDDMPLHHLFGVKSFGRKSLGGRCHGELFKLWR